MTNSAIQDVVRTLSAVRMHMYVFMDRMDKLSIIPSINWFLAEIQHLFALVTLHHLSRGITNEFSINCTFCSLAQ